jgi:hypothetical protein
MKKIICTNCHREFVLSKEGFNPNNYWCPFCHFHHVDVFKMFNDIPDVKKHKNVDLKWGIVLIISILFFGKIIYDIFDGIII